MQAQDRKQPKSGPSPTVNIKKPQSFTLKNGLKVLVVENSKLPRVTYSLTLDNPPYAEGTKKGVSDLLSSLLGSGTEKISKNDTQAFIFSMDGYKTSAQLRFFTSKTIFAQNVIDQPALQFDYLGRRPKKAPCPS